MYLVRSFESDLLRILHVILGRAPALEVLGLLMKRQDRPQCLTAPAVEVIQRTLGKGLVWWMAIHDGWIRTRHMRSERAVEGRLWERTRPQDLALHFSEHTLEWLIRLTAEPLDKRRPDDWDPPESSLTMGDRLVLYWTYRVFHGTEAMIALRRMPVIRRHGLCRLSFPQDALRVTDLLETPVQLKVWLTEPGTWILEVLQRDLARRWVEVERGKGRLTDTDQIRRLGQAQDELITDYLETIRARGRPDLARFLLMIASDVFAAPVQGHDWVGQLVVNRLRLAERAAIYQSALSLPRALETLRLWEVESRGIGYFDEGYAASQLFKADWQTYDGARLHEHARQLSQALDPLGTVAEAGSGDASRP